MIDSIAEPRSQSISRSVAGNSTVLSHRGALTFENCGELEKAMRAVRGHKPEIVLDCRGLTLMDSEALELLMAMHEHLEKQGGGLKMANLNEVCSDILMVTRLVNVLHVYKDVNQALRSV